MAAGIDGVVVRDATDGDMADVQGIYAHHVLNGLATFEEVPPAVDEMRGRQAPELARLERGPVIAERVAADLPGQPEQDTGDGQSSHEDPAVAAIRRPRSP